MYLCKYLGDFSRHFIMKFYFIRLPFVFLDSLLESGWSITIMKTRQKLTKIFSIKKSKMYFEMFPNSDVLNLQRKKKFKEYPLISVLVPLYNTNTKYFADMINSVINQTYHHWELILVDANEISLETEVQYFEDSRIKYIRLNENKGIAGNTNEAYGIARGEYVALLDHDDILNIQCLFKIVEKINDGADFIYTDEITFKINPKLDCYNPNLKPDFSPDTLRSCNYICHFSCFKKDLIHSTEAFLNEDMEGSQDYDLYLRLSERASNICHVPMVLYYWRAHKKSTADSHKSKPYVLESAKKALNEHLLRLNLNGSVINGCVPTTYRINYKISGNPLVSIIIPTSDHLNDLRTCIESILIKTAYTNYEILLIENNSKQVKTFEYYKKIQNNKVHIIEYDDEFNYSKINNFGIQYAKGEYLLLLNNDTEVITSNWIEEMLMLAQRSDVGCVGAKLLYPDDTIQHAGVIVGVGGVAGHSCRYMKKDKFGFMNRLQIVQNLSAVTAACLMMKKELYQEIGGFDEKFIVAFNDVDLCLRIRDLNKLCIFTPYAQLYHYESKSRGKDDSPKKKARFNNEIKYFELKWGLWKNDPYYNINLSLRSETFDLQLENRN